MFNRRWSCFFAAPLALVAAALTFPSPDSALHAEGVRIQPVGGVVAAFESISQVDGGPLLAVRSEALAEAGRRGGKVVIGRLPLGGESAALELTSTRVVGPATRIVVGQAGGPDRPLAYDTSAVHVFHGRVQGKPDSNVVLFTSPRRIGGHIDLGAGQGRYKLSSIDAGGRKLDPGQAMVFPAPAMVEGLPDVPLCGNESESTVAGCCAEPAPGAVFNKKLKTVEIALETDYDLYANFNDLNATTDHLLEIMARTNALFMSSLDVRFEVVFLRLFDNPGAEPAFMNNADPLSGYVNFWNTNMTGVARDTGAFMSGRRDLPYGGIAYIGAVCTTSAYCVCGYLRGFPNPAYPSWGDYDTGVTIHELGHNFDACHTPDYCPQIDRCFPPPVVPQRGTVMSYCSQSVSGGDMAEDRWYHRRLLRVMRSFVETSALCVQDDCNQNNIPDATDISDGASLDTNGNGVPDECEDCQPNGVLDPADIAGPSDDDNLNGVPDECEPDCNGNFVPDDRDIVLGTSVDFWGNSVPDECDPDCDGDSTPDYDEIQASLPLDIDRNVILDACQDCDGDGISDLIELGGARNAWVASDVLDYIGEYHAVSGVRVKTSTTGLIATAQDLIIVPGMNAVLVSGGTSNKVVRYDATTGSYVSDFVPAGSGGLNNAAGLIIGPNGNLFVSSRNGNNVLQYNGATGAFIGVFVAANSGGLTGPFGLTFGPNGNLFVAGSNQVWEFDGVTGAFVRVFVSSSNNGGLQQARGILFKPDGNLLVASYNTDAILQYHGTTGAFLGKWNSGGTSTALYLDGPWGLRLGPNGNVFASRDLPAAEGEDDHDHDEDHDHGIDVDRFPIDGLHVTSARIMEFDIGHGKYVRSYVLGDDTGLRSTTGFDFMPGTLDCNYNMLPDSCDLASCAGNPACADCNGNSLPDGCDLAACSGDSTCADCNLNSAPDGCDIAGGDSPDGNSNGVPDECEPPPEVVPQAGGEATRGLSFSAPPPVLATGEFGRMAIRVTMVELQNPIPPNAPCCQPTNFSAFEVASCSAAGEANGCARWVGPPALFLESQGNPSIGANRAARLQCTPYYHEWGGEGVVHVTGADVMPSSTYSVTVYAAVCKGNESTCMAASNPVTLITRRAGDIVAPFNPPDGSPQPEGVDVAAAVNKFKNLPESPAKFIVQAQPNVTDPNADADALDIAAVVDNVKGFAYPFSGPCACPSAVTCNATPCASATVCVSTHGPGSMCVRTCSSGPKMGQACAADLHCGACSAASSNAGVPCDADADCPGGVCDAGDCPPDPPAAAGFCRDRCGRCN